MPVEPPPSRWILPDPTVSGGDDLVGIGGDLEPGTILDGYRRGLFPMPVSEGLAWWSPSERGIIPLDGLQVSHSLAKSCRRLSVTIDGDFEGVVLGCSDPGRPFGWITPEFRAAYVRLHELGWAHSFETRDDDGNVVGGLYGLAIGGAFFGESMFHRVRDASKVALVHLVRSLRSGGARLLDVQWVTPHLKSLGAVGIPRRTFLAHLEAALQRPLPEVFTG